MTSEDKLMRDEEYPFQVMNSTLFRDYSVEFLRGYYTDAKEWYFKYPETFTPELNLRLNHLCVYLEDKLGVEGDWN